jgi:hypothetical protein
VVASARSYINESVERSQDGKKEGERKELHTRGGDRRRKGIYMYIEATGL